MSSVLVTGGAGFIGSNLVKILTRAGHDVVVVDKLTYASNRKYLEGIRHAFYERDINDDLYDVFHDHMIDAVFHLAAESHVDNSILGPDEFIRTNINGTYNLLQHARTWYESCPEVQETFRFIHVSTDEVYGDLPLGQGFFTEQTPYNPSSPYSSSKAASDHLVQAWHRTYKFPTIITHCSNNYGPNQHTEKFIPTILRCIEEHKDVPVYGEGKNERDWIHVYDHVRGLIAAWEKGILGEVYNFGGDNVMSNNDMVKAIYDAYKVCGIPVVGYPVYVKDRAGHDLRYAIDSSKAKRELDWKPEEDFNARIMDLISDRCLLQ